MINQKSWSLGTNEIGKACGANVGKIYKVYIAKIIPLVKFGKPKSKTIALSKNCYVNASDCKPSIASKVKTVNYIKVPLSANCSIKPRAKTKHGVALKINVNHNSPDQLSVLGKKDKVIK